MLRLVYAGNARRLLFRELPGGAGGHVTLHLMPATRWEAWRAVADPGAPYRPAGFEEDGFVHCTDGDAEMLVVANRYYAAQPGPFVVADVDLGLAGAPWRYDEPDSPYPHVYGPLRRDAVLRVRAVQRDGEGRFLGFGAPAAL